jgi:hypothetical protein
MRDSQSKTTILSANRLPRCWCTAVVLEPGSAYRTPVKRLLHHRSIALNIDTDEACHL